MIDVVQPMELVYDNLCLAEVGMKIEEDSLYAFSFCRVRGQCNSVGGNYEYFISPSAAVILSDLPVIPKRRKLIELEKLILGAGVSPVLWQNSLVTSGVASVSRSANGAKYDLYRR